MTHISVLIVNHLMLKFVSMEALWSNIYGCPDQQPLSYSLVEGNRSLLLPDSCHWTEYELQCQKTYFRSCAPSEFSDQPAYLHSLIRTFTEYILDSQGCKVSSCRQLQLIRLCGYTHSDGKFSHCDSYFRRLLRHYRLHTEQYPFHYLRIELCPFHCLHIEPCPFHNQLNIAHFTIYILNNAHFTIYILNHAYSLSTY